MARGSARVAAFANVYGAGLPPTPSYNQSSAREGLSGRECALCFLSAKCLLPDFHLGAFAEPAGTEAVWRCRAWKTHKCHSALFSSPLQASSHGVGLSATTGEWLGDCSLSFWRAPVSGGLRVLCVGIGVCFCRAQSTVGTGPS